MDTIRADIAVNMHVVVMTFGWQDIRGQIWQARLVVIE